MSVRMRFGVHVSVDQEYQRYVDTTYEAFLELAKSLSPSTRLLTDNDRISQLQDVYFLLRQGVIQVTEEKTREGVSSLSLEFLAPID